MPRLPRQVTVLLLAVAFATAAAAEAGERFATIGETVISAADFEAALERAVRQKFYHREVPEAKLDEFRREVAGALIDRVLLLAEARRRGIAPDAARIGKAIAHYDERYSQSEAWKKNREAMVPGLTRALEERDVLEQLQAAVRSVEIPAKADLLAYYEGNAQLFTEPEQTRLSVILLKVDPSSPGAAWEAAVQEAQSIRRRLAAGADFAELARIHSTDASAARGGDMGYLHRGMLPEALHERLGGMAPGESSEPLKLLEGVALFRVADRKAARARAFHEVKERAAQLWQRGEGERRWAELVSSLRRAATIEIDTARYPALAGLASEARAAQSQ